MTTLTRAQLEAANRVFSQKHKRRLLNLGTQHAVGKALRELQHGDMNRALLMFAAVLERWPRAHHALYFAALGAYQAGSNPPNGDMEIRRRCWAVAEMLMRHCLLVMDPADAGAAYPHYNLGKFLMDTGRRREAAQEFHRAIDYKGDMVEALNNLGSIYLGDGANDVAEEYFAKALAVDTDSPESLYNRSFLRLLKGDLTQGFRDYEARWRCPGFMVEYARDWHTANVPFWTGEPLEGRTLLVYAEQGMGDTIQMLRYLPGVLEKADGPVVIEVQRPLVTLTQANVPDSVTVVAQGDALPGIHAHASMMSLPHLNGGAIPEWRGPYLTTGEPTRTESTSTALNIGLCWAGSIGHKGDATRSIPFEVISTLGDTPGVNWHSLQVGPRERKADWLVPAGDRFPDYLATARHMTTLDAVVSVDTSVCHLSGALGVPTFTLLPVVTDWRWRLEGDTTDWYPTMQLHRTKAGETWADVIARVKWAIQQLAR
jgi:tetratricopeptide (TPR) repeat protein